MDIAYEIAQYLDNANFGTIGTDIFVGQLPSETQGLYILRTGGQLNLYNPIEETVMDIYCQKTNASSAIDTLEDVKRFIHRMHSTLTTNAHIYSILVIGDVEDVDRDLEYDKIFKISISVIHRSLGLIS